MNMHYILDGKNVVEEPDLMKWAEWMSKNSRHIKDDIGDVKLRGKKIGAVRVLTIFLGLDHSCGRDEGPILFETMIFGGELDGYQDRCSTYEAAEKMHELACEKVKLAVKNIF